MMIAIQIKTELVEWVQERLDIDADEAQNFAEEFAGMLYFSGGFPDPQPPAPDPLHQAAPALLALLTEGIGIPKSEDFATDLERIAGALDMEYFIIAQRLRAKAQAIRAAVAEAKGSEPYLANYDYSGDMRDEDVQGF